MKTCLVPGCVGAYYAKGWCEKHYKRISRSGSVCDGPRAPGTLESRFWRKVLIAGESDCWLWQGQIMSNGYGGISRGKRHEGRVSAHRAAVEIMTGKRVPSDKVVMHLCDNPTCVNPKHLKVGSYQENTQDMIDKGRHRFFAPLGEENGVSKLNPEKVTYIRTQGHKTHAALGRELDVGASCIRSVRDGRTWGHVK